MFRNNFVKISFKETVGGQNEILHSFRLFPGAWGGGWEWASRG